jgi:hypothetical protein
MSLIMADPILSDQVVVFLGPTLRRELAQPVLNATYAPPAEQGHLVDAVQRIRPRTVVLIDGAFASVPAVRHNEILWALSRGVEVFGASSLGALRAAELAGFGMKGHGLIYRWYRATPFADDDEVAVAMTPPDLGADALGDALIDMRITLRCAERAGIIPPDLHGALVDAARSIHYLERSYASVLARASAGAPAQWLSPLRRLEAWIPGNAVRQKQDDAISLLRMLRARPHQGSTPSPSRRPPFRLTEAFAYDIDAAGLDPGQL